MPNRASVLSEQARALAISSGRGVAQERAFRKARLSRRDAGRGLLFIGGDGRRFRDLAAAQKSGRAVWIVAVDRRGRKTVFNPFDRRTVGHRGVKPRREPQKIGNFDFSLLARRRPRQLAKLVPPAPTADRIEGREKLHRSDLAPAGAALARGFVRGAAGFANHTHWGARVGLLLSDGRRVEFVTKVFQSFHFFRLMPAGAPGRRAGRLKLRSQRTLTAAFQAAVFQGAAGALLRLGLIGQGSASRIRRLSGNGGKSAKKWRTKDGLRWRGAGKKPVAVAAVEWRLDRTLLE